MRVFDLTADVFQKIHYFFLYMRKRMFNIQFEYINLVIKHTPNPKYHDIYIYIYIYICFAFLIC
jgi:hypothetical protein